MILSFLSSSLLYEVSGGKEPSQCTVSVWSFPSQPVYCVGLFSLLAQPCGPFHEHLGSSGNLWERFIDKEMNQQKRKRVFIHF